MSAGAVPPVSVLINSPDDHSWIPNTVSGSYVSLLDNEVLFALHIAAVGHDVGHPGFNNMFMVSYTSRLCLCGAKVLNTNGT